MISVAILAPLMGGLEYRGRMRIFSWDSTAFTSCSLLQIKVRAPTRSPGEENGEREKGRERARWEKREKEGREGEGQREEGGGRHKMREVIYS